MYLYLFIFMEKRWRWSGYIVGVGWLGKGILSCGIIHNEEHRLWQYSLKLNIAEPSYIYHQFYNIDNIKKKKKNSWAQNCKKYGK